MDSRDAVDLLSLAIQTHGDTWADLGAGSGVFTRALVELLGADCHVYAVDRDVRVTTANITADVLLARLATLVKSGGAVVLVEYDRRAASRWVPYPISSDGLTALADAAGLSRFVVTARRPSAFGGELYVAIARI